MAGKVKKFVQAIRAEVRKSTNKVYYFDVLLALN